VKQAYFGQNSFVSFRDVYLKKVTDRLGAMGFTPTILNLLGLTFGIIASIQIIKKRPHRAILFLGASTVVDILDGALARNSGMESKLGTVFDAACDRAVDLAIYSGFLSSSLVDKNYIVAFLSWLNLITDTVRSYIRARGEIIVYPETLEVGVMTRPRKLIFILAALFHDGLLPFSLAINAALNITSIIERLTRLSRLYRSTEDL